MGNCACSSFQSQELPVLVYRVPEPLMFSTERFMLLHFTDHLTVGGTFAEFKANLNDGMAIEVIKYAFLTDNGEVAKMMIYVRGVSSEPASIQTAMLIERVEEKVVVQYGKASLIDLITYQQRRRIVINFKPPVTYFKLNMVRILERLHQKCVDQAKEVSSLKQIMKFLKSLTTE